MQYGHPVVWATAIAFSSFNLELNLPASSAFLSKATNALNTSGDNLLNSPKRFILDFLYRLSLVTIIPSLFIEIFRKIRSCPWFKRFSYNLQECISDKYMSVRKEA